MAKARKPSSDVKELAAQTTGLRPIYVVFGPDDGLRSRSLQSLLARLAQEDGTITEFSGGDFGLAEVLDELRTLPMFTAHRIVVVRDADTFISKYREQLEDYFTSPSPTGSLVLDSKRWTSTTRLAKIADRIGESIRCAPPSGRDFQPWLIQHAASLNKRLEPAAAQLLFDLLGKDEPAIYLAEIEKLATYVGDRPAITIQDVQALVSPMRSELVFAVTDAMADHDVGRALGLWEQVLASDKEAQYKAVGGLAWGLRRLMRARRLVDRGMSPEDAAKELKLWGPDISARIRAFTTRQLEAQLAQLAQIDVSTKSGGDIRTEVQNFIVAACARA